MKKVKLCSGRTPYSFIAFNTDDEKSAEPFILQLNNNGYRFWFNCKREPTISDNSLINEKLSGAAVIVIVLTPRALTDRYVSRAIKHGAQERKPILIYIPSSTPEINPFLDTIISSPNNVVIFRAYEENFASSNSAKFLLAKTLGFADELVKKLYDTGVLMTKDENPDIIKKGMHYISYAANDDYTPAIYFLANIELQRAEKGLSSYNRAINLLHAGALLGDMDCVYRLGTLIYDGIGFEENPAIAFKFFALAANHEIADAEFKLAEMYDTGVGVTVDRTKSIILYERAIAHGNKNGYLPLAYRYLNGGIDNKSHQSLKKAARCFDAASKNGIIEADFMLAKLYADGMGVRKDLLKSTEYFKKAAECGMDEAIYRYAVCLRDGIGCKKNPKEAFRWFELATIEKSDDSEVSPDAMFQLAQCYEKGFGVTKNLQSAFHYYYLAAQSGHKKSQRAVSECYKYGTGVPINHRASAFFKKLAEE